MNVTRFNNAYKFYTAFAKVPFGDRTNIHYPPGERKIDLDGLLAPHPTALMYIKKEREGNKIYWDDEWWGYLPENLKTIDLDKIVDVFFVQLGYRDDDEGWLAVITVRLNGEKVYLFLKASCCYTGFGVSGGVHIYASRDLRSLRTMCMTPAEETLAFGKKLVVPAND